MNTDENDIPAQHAVARRGDPSTSWEAARSVDHALTENQQRFLAELRHLGPSTDEQLVEADPWRLFMAPSGIRTRRHELTVSGQVVDTGRRVIGSTGRRMIVWRARGETEAAPVSVVVPAPKTDPELVAPVPAWQCLTCGTRTMVAVEPRLGGFGQGPCSTCNKRTMMRGVQS